MFFYILIYDFGTELFLKFKEHKNMFLTTFAKINFDE